MSNEVSTRERPLSPHLGIYKPIPTMVMSIVHRITGIALYFGTLLVVWWLIAAASGPGYFDWVSGFFGSWLGLLALFGYTWALLHHLLGGLRHFVWDTGHGLDKELTARIALMLPVASVALTILVWIIAYIAG